MIARIAPGDDESTIRECRDRGEGPVVLRCRIDLKFAADLVAGPVENLCFQRDGTIRAAVIVPYHDEIAVGQSRDLRSDLRAIGYGIHQKLAAGLGAVGVEDLRFDGARAAVSPAAEVFPGDNKSAAGQRRDLRCILAAWSCRIDQELAIELAAVGIKDLRLYGADALVTTLAAGVFPGHHETAICKRRHRRLILRACGRRIDQELAA